MAKSKYQFFLAIGILLGSLAASNSYADEAPRVANPNDPYEPFNRVMYDFNDFLDRILLKPLATVYSKVVPKPISKGISNIFNNIDDVPTIANDILQFNFYQATSDTWRLILNTTIGLGGFFDVATSLGLEINSEDLGLTLARWGWESSNYLVLPFIGPTSVRDGVAWPINYNFLTIYPLIHDVAIRNSLYGIAVVSKRAQYLQFQDVMEQASLDKYNFMRDAYMQRRSYQIERNKQLGDPYLSKNTNVENVDKAGLASDSMNYSNIQS
jgi:phospholipid-binding lipoprotein MlaA